MEELNEVTRQYLNCSNPIEAAARRQRVLAGDAGGEVEETALAIIESAKKNLLNASHSTEADSNPVTPPPVVGNYLQNQLCPEPPVMYTPPERLVDDLGPDPNSNVAPRNENQQGENNESGRTAKLKSIMGAQL